MAEPFVAEIRIVGFNFAPRGWAFCDGQILPINQNQSLYAILGTTYGGDGITSFALPDLRGRTPIHPSDGYELGQRGGVETVTLQVPEMPGHEHAAEAIAKPGTQSSPANNLFAEEVALDLAYAPSNGLRTALRAGSMTNAGGGQGHNNMQPYATVNFCIALQGLFPSRN